MNRLWLIWLSQLKKRPGRVPTVGIILTTKGTDQISFQTFSDTWRARRQEKGDCCDLLGSSSGTNIKQEIKTGRAPAGKIEIIFKRISGAQLTTY